MAFLRYANALVVKPQSTQASWTRVRTAGRVAGSPSRSLVEQASGILGTPFDPERYILSHCTIVASVDTGLVPGIKTGSVVEGGKKINRKYADFRITPETESLINNNRDAFPRGVIEKSYRTFIGAQNFCFAPNTPVMMGDGTYLPIEAIRVGDKVRTHTGAVRAVVHTFERNYTGDIRAIRVGHFKDPIFVTGNHPFRAIQVEAPPLTSYSTSKLSSQVRYRQDKITSVLRGEDASFGMGAPLLRKVRDYMLSHGPCMAGDVAEALGHDRGYGQCLQTKCLKKHPDFFSCRPLQAHEHPHLRKGRTRIRMWELRADAPSLPSMDFRADKVWVEASDLAKGSIVLGPEQSVGGISCRERATLLGYYLAEGCMLSPHKDEGVVLTFGDHERALVEHVKTLAESCFPNVSARIQNPHNGALKINLRGAEIGKWLREMGGVYSEGKYLHPNVFNWDRESLLYMMAAWLSGDGDFHGGTLRLRGSTASPKMGAQIQYLMEMCGIKSSLVFCPQEIGVPQHQVSLVVGGAPRWFDIIPRHHMWTVFVSKDSTAELACRTVRWGAPLYDATKQAKRAELAWWGGCRTHFVSENVPVPYTGKVYNFEVEGDNSYVVAPGLAVHNCEHVQVEELSKGRIIDAVLRDVGHSLYVDILVATDRKHTELVADILSERMNGLSMGCSVESCTCTKCGNVAIDETDMCDCIKYAKGNRFIAEDGKHRIVAELCGHPTLDPTGGVTFIEASWVASPAFTGAVMRNILEPQALTEAARKQAQVILSSPPPQWVSEVPGVGTRRAASRLENMAPAVSLRTNVLGMDADKLTAGFDFGDDAPAEEDGAAPADGAEKKPSVFDTLEDDILTQMSDRVKKRIEKELGKKDEAAKPKPEDSSLWQNNSITKTALNRAASFVRRAYLVNVDAILRTASSDADVMNRVAYLDRTLGLVPASGVAMYRAALQAGPRSKFSSSESYLRACRDAVGSDLGRSDAATLLRLGRVLSHFYARGGDTPPRPPITK